MDLNLLPDDLRSLNWSVEYALNGTPKAYRTIRPIGGNRVSVYVRVPNADLPIAEFAEYLATLAGDLENVRVSWFNHNLSYGDDDESSLSLYGEREAFASDLELVRKAHQREISNARWIEQDARAKAERLEAIASEI